MNTNESQFGDIDSWVDSGTARANGENAGYWPEDYNVAELTEKAKEGNPTPISGTAMAKGAKSRKEHNASRENSYGVAPENRATVVRGSGIIQSGKLVKGGNVSLASSLYEKGKK
jgi:hypothetical protein